MSDLALYHFKVRACAPADAESKVAAEPAWVEALDSVHRMLVEANRLLAASAALTAPDSHAGEFGASAAGQTAAGSVHFEIAPAAIYDPQTIHRHETLPGGTVISRSVCALTFGTDETGAIAGYVHHYDAAQTLSRAEKTHAPSEWQEMTAKAVYAAVPEDRRPALKTQIVLEEQQRYASHAETPRPQA